MFYLYATMDLLAESLLESTRFLGVDLGIINIATDSDGHIYMGMQVRHGCQRCATACQTLQRTSTKAAKCRLKKLSSKEERFSSFG
jgi:putative transposase